jgi:hypothetical protein
MRLPGLRYAKTWGSLLPEYKSTLIPNLRIMQYSGDADPCVPYVGEFFDSQPAASNGALANGNERTIYATHSTTLTAFAGPGTQRWIDSLELPTATPWHPWSGGPGSFISGYTTVYSGPGIGSNFTFTTVRDAGHMAPRYKPSETLHMITQFLSKQPM